jgi:winged helix DNA-binding protein
MPSSAATAVTPKQVAAFRLGRQHLARRAPKAALVAVVEEMAGAQAQVLSAAQIALATRTKGLSLDDVDAAIAQRRVVKVGCMRRTLYLVPSSLVAVFVRGTARRAEQGVRWALRKGVPSAVVEAAIDAALGALDEPLTRPELAERACRTLGVRPRRVHGGGWGSRGKVAAVPVGALTYPVVDLLHLAAARGVVCYGEQRNGEPTFVRADAWVPDYEDVTPEEAEDRLLRRYLEAFGPATVADFAVWTGMTLREAGSIWARAEDELATVDVDGEQGSMLRASRRELSRARVESPHVRLLPYFDSYLLGHRDRRHLVSDEHRHRVSRSQGWIAPVVLVDGRVAAVWKHARGRAGLEVEVTPLERLARPVVAAIRTEAEELRRFLGADEVQVSVTAG